MIVRSTPSIFPWADLIILMKVLAIWQNAGEWTILRCILYVQSVLGMDGTARDMIFQALCRN